MKAIYDVEEKETKQMESICDVSLKTWLTEQEAIVYTGYHRDVLRAARDNSKLTFYKKKGKERATIRYKRPDLDRFMEREHDECKALAEMPFSRRRFVKD